MIQVVLKKCLFAIEGFGLNHTSDLQLIGDLSFVTISFTFITLLFDLAVVIFATLLPSP